MIEAIIDTGFDGALCLPTVVAVPLGLELINQVEVELADGTVKADLLFAGAVRFLGQTKEVMISLTDSEEPLIGIALLADCRLTVDFPTAHVKLARRRQ